MKGSPVTKGCFEACMDIDFKFQFHSLNFILHAIRAQYRVLRQKSMAEVKVNKPEKATTVLQDQTQQAPSRNQSKLIVFAFLL